jgi:ferredoxin
VTAISDANEMTSTEPQGLRYYVDEALCCAHGQCAAIAPGLFVLDEDGFNRQAGKGWMAIDESQRELALAAERGCPDAAIRVID